MLLVLCGPAGIAQSRQPEIAARASSAYARAGDRVTMRVFGEPSMSDVATVDELGRVVLPRIGTIQADAMSIAALRDTVRQRVSLHVRDAAVEVTVARRVIVSGEVGRPGVYHVELTSSIGEVIAQAGGLRESASSSKVYILRSGATIQVPHWESVEAAEFDIASGDRIVVGRKSWLALNVIPVVSVATSVVALIISLNR
jgi:protein involved in polysaccharide export with SLBB domain